MKKQMEGDNEQRRAKAKEARDEGRLPSEDGVTTGASNQRRTLPNRADYEERLTGSGWGKQQPDRVARQPRPGSRSPEAAATGAPGDTEGFPPRSEVQDVEPGALTPEDEQVFEAIARLEGERDAPTLGDIADAAGLPVDEAEPAVQRLIDRHDVVRELPATDEVGRRYAVKSR